MSVCTYHGAEAIAQVTDREGALTPAQIRIVELEGFVDGEYTDTKGIKTAGVGQTGVWLNKPFKDAFAAKEAETIGQIPSYACLPTLVQAELVQAHYRGDLRQSPTAVKLFNQGKYGQAATEFLNHDEYRNTDRQQIKDRMESVSSAMWSLQP